MLKGVVGLVTGGASGLGRATVERIVREGGKVTMCDLPSSQGAAVASAINSPNCIFVPTDITNSQDVENALAETKVRLWIKSWFYVKKNIFLRPSLVVWTPLSTVRVLEWLSKFTISIRTELTLWRTLSGSRE